jgi:hypothetical protein
MAEAYTFYRMLVLALDDGILEINNIKFAEWGKK